MEIAQIILLVTIAIILGYCADRLREIEDTLKNKNKK